MIGITERGDAGHSMEWTSWVIKKRPAILITKRADRLCDILTHMVDRFDMNIIVHCTITGLGGTYHEPHVPPAEIEIDSYHHIANLIGNERTVLRIDPIFPSWNTMKDISKIISKRIVGGRLRVSFIDAYNHVRTRYVLAKNIDPFSWKGLHAPLEWRLECLKMLPIDTEVCGEPGIPCTGCVSEKDLKTFRIVERTDRKGQRAACSCISAKTELLSTIGQCPNKCLYCYWR